MSDQEPQLTEQQGKVLLELEMILTTVKQIDANLQNSIDTLSGSSLDSAHQDLVVKNTQRLTEILALLKPNDQTQQI